MQNIMKEQHSSNYNINSGYYTSQQLIIAFDVLCIGFIGFLTFSVFKFYTKGNLIIMGKYKFNDRGIFIILDNKMGIINILYINRFITKAIK